MKKDAVMISTIMELVKKALEDENNDVSARVERGRKIDEDGIVRVTNQERITININCNMDEEIDKTL
jgi:hypothetical protein